MTDADDPARSVIHEQACRAMSREPIWRAVIRRRPGMSAGVALFVAMAVWSVLTPLFAGPDESSNTVKAAAVVRGVWVGNGQPPSVATAYFQTTVDIDARFGNPNQIPWCFAPYPDKPACDRPMQDVQVVEDPPYTNVGRYPPLGFALPGLATYLGPTNSAVRLARLLNAAWAALLLGIGIGAARRDGVGTVPLLVVLSPMVLFLGSIVSPSGIEVAAALALWLVGRRLVRGELSGRSERAGAGLALVSLVVARPIGAVLAGLILLACWIAAHAERPLALARRHPITATIAAAATAFMAAWYLHVFRVQLRHPVVADQPSIGRLRILLQSFGHLPGLLREMVGNFGWLDTPAPSAVSIAWLGGFAAMAVAAFVRSERRTRLVIVGTAVTTVALSLYLDADYYRILRNFGVQGRHLLPVAFGVALVGAHALRINRAAARLVALAWVGLQWACGVFALRRYAVGVTPDNLPTMFTAPVWQPRFTVVATLVLLAVSLAIVALVLLASEPGVPGGGPLAAASQPPATG